MAGNYGISGGCGDVGGAKGGKGEGRVGECGEFHRPAAGDVNAAVDTAAGILSGGASAAGSAVGCFLGKLDPGRF